MQFADPHYLLLLLAVAWIWVPAWRARGPARRTAAAHAFIALLLVLGLSGLRISGGRASMTVMFALDRSDSMSTVASLSRGLIDRLTVGMRASDRMAVLSFGGDAILDRRPGPRAAVTALASRPAAGSTDIETALRVARAALPTGGVRRIVLMSDGQETSGDALAEAGRAASEGVHIDVVLPSEGPLVAPLTIDDLQAPARVRSGEPFPLVATFHGVEGARGEIVLTSEDGVATTLPVTVPRGGTGRAEFSDLRQEPGEYAYRASTGATETEAGGDPGGSAGAVVMVSGEPRVLYVGSTPRTLDAALRQARFRVDRVSAASVPRTASALAAYDAIVLDDVPPDALDQTQGAAVARYVEQSGGGLLVLGGPRSLSASIAATPLGAVLPVDVRPRTARRAPALALVIVFDKSGSMDDRIDGVSKIELSRQAVQGVIDALPASDAVGVIAFDTAARPIMPLRPGHDGTSVGDALRAVTAGGATAITPALRMAAEWLRAPEAAAFPRRHVVLVSDGRTSPSDAAEAVKAVAGQGFELSAIASGTALDRQVLSDLAERTGGRAVFTDDARQLPALAAREATRVAGGGVAEGVFAVTVSAHPLAAGTDGVFPHVNGYVVSAARPQTRTVLASTLADPILATSHAGLGRVAVYTADLHGRWSDSCRRSPACFPLFVQAVRWLAPPMAREAIVAYTWSTDAGMRTVVEVAPETQSAGRPIEVRVLVRAPGGGVTDTPLQPVGPGRFEADIPSSESGSFSLRFSVTDGQRMDLRVARGFYRTADREQRHAGVNRLLLQSIAQATGGRVLEADAAPFSDARPPAFIDVSAFLLGSAVALFLLELLIPAGITNVWRNWRRGRLSRRGPSSAGSHDSRRAARTPSPGYPS